MVQNKGIRKVGRIFFFDGNARINVFKDILNYCLPLKAGKALLLSLGLHKAAMAYFSYWNWLLRHLHRWLHKYRL